MPYFFVHTHTKRDRPGSTMADRSGPVDPGIGLEGEHGLSAEAIKTGAQRRALKHGEIAKLAYSYWEARGRQDGSPWEDWFRAERELKERGAL
ncbi:MAG: DUF2934 domain-containing protein [Acidobacteriia bacterium]|nr:DUF2934 domain-containing protein [Terriglobia bacterium]